MSEKSPSKLPSPAVLRQRRKAAAGLGVALAFLGVNGAKPIGNAAKRAATPIVRVVHDNVSEANRNSEIAKLPALDTPFQVRGPQDTPDNIAEHSGVTGSENRHIFDQKILYQARAQGFDELKRDMVISVPTAYVEYVENQANQVNE